jgi:PAS domain S-box-containing protein
MSTPGKHKAGSKGPTIEKELRRQTKRFKPVLEISPTAIVITDLANRVASWNPAAERLFGYSAKEAAGRDLDDLVAGTDELHAEAESFRGRVAASEHVRSITRRTRKDGSIVDVELLAAPMIANGEPVGTFAIYHDITEAHRRQRFFEALLEMSPEAIVTTDMHEIVTSWNPAAEQLFGFTSQEVLGRNIDDLVAAREDLRIEGEEIDRQSTEGRTVRIVTQRTRKDGTLVDVDVVGGPVKVGGEFVAKHVFYHDITELQEQKRYFESLLEISPAAIVITDLDSKIVSWNPAAERLFGYTADEAVGRKTDDLVATRPDMHEQAKAYTEAAAQGEHIQAVTQRTRKDGSLVDVDVLIVPVMAGTEQTGFLIIYHDISELQEQKRYFQSLVEISPAAVVVTNLKSEVVSWNPGAETIFGYPADEAIGKHLDDLVATRADLYQEALGYSEAAGRGERVHATARRTRKDGSLVDVQMLSAPVIVSEERVGYVVIYHDITDIQRQKRYYESLVELNPVAIALMAPDGTVTSWNPAAERLFGYAADEAIGRNIDDLVAANDEVRIEAEAQTEQGMGGELVHAITRRTHKDGTLVDVEVFGASVIVAGEAVGLYGLYHDIRELQEARRDAEAATEAKSAFLATMSHEIRTPLNAVLGMTGLLLDTELTAEQRNYAEVTRNSGDALLGVINDILDFSKIEAGRLDLDSAPFDLRECVESALELVAAGALKKGLDIAYDMDPDAPGALVGDVTRLRQVLINLLNNAVKFTERGEVVVTVSAERLDSSDRHRVHFAVRDTGIGIPEDRRGRLFESFSQLDPSTTRRYGGTGLGLAISKRLADLMGGAMWVESEPGGGSTFHFTVEAEAAAAPARAFEHAGPSQLVGRRVLIVDDNATNRHILVRQTESWGMFAVETETPHQALEWIRRGDPFDVAILDMQMPVMDGRTLAVEIRRHRDAHALPLVMLTSLGSEKIPVEFAAYLTKPIKPSQLHDALMVVFGGELELHEAPWAATTDDRLAERLPLRILVVEDNAVNQQLILLLLQKVGYRADVAANGVEALEALERQPYDAVLMDVEMPEMDGLEATRRIHQRWSRARPHIIAVTANAMQGERELCIQAGMDEYISKPIHIDVLAEALSRVSRRPDAPQPAESVDAGVIGKLVSSLGDQGRRSTAALIDTFLAHAPDLTAALTSAVERGEAGDVRRLAHTLKANAATFGAVGLEGLCRELEAGAKAGTLDRGGDLLAEIAVELERVTEELERVRAELGG